MIDETGCYSEVFIQEFLIGTPLGSILGIGVSPFLTGGEQVGRITKDAGTGTTTRTKERGKKKVRAIRARFDSSLPPFLLLTFSDLNVIIE